ncbi:MAG: enoyl-CoA hydratase [Hydrocarboniphaga sp.]|uniref:enoyl-CoA hydratase/isomerase family protein n=1 Tax=Hydrocarboniphaga sp. TaxID=2033016 RepID=UPI00261F23BA|nr:enoyl-CoA hydratase-related protein [Hydrocarboniphaga sp.]MDB5969667.1 enoyl-CoA hydratase [Hydrocarboniphaga sp.]
MSVTESRETLIADGPALLELRPGGIGHLQMNRPASANGLNLEMLQGLHLAVQRCMTEPRIRVVLLTGKGANFCAGGDVHVFASKGDELPYFIRQATALLQVVIGALIHLDAPLVAAVQGFTAGGGGMGLLCASDLVIASESAKFLAGATRVGMAPDAGLSVTLPRLIGARKAAEMLLMNPTVSAAEALESGLINRVVPDAELEASALAYAMKLAAGAPLALAATKRLLWAGVGLGVDAAMPEEARTVAALCHTQDVREGLAAVIEKRSARFIGR